MCIDSYEFHKMLDNEMKACWDTKDGKRDLSWDGQRIVESLKLMFEIYEERGCGK